LEDPGIRNLNYEELKSFFEIALQPWLSAELPDLLTELADMRKRAPGEGLLSKFSLEAPRLRLGGLITRRLEEAEQVAGDPEGRHMIRALGGYQLGESIEGATGLTEFSAAEYAAFRIGNPKLLPDERIFKGPRTSFDGVEWTVMVGSARGKIYKIALQHIARDSSSANKAFQRTRQYFLLHIGKESERSTSPERYIWDAEEGNVLLERLDVKVLGESIVNLYLTSRFPFR
jgi:hypothetical protein